MNDDKRIDSGKDQRLTAAVDVSDSCCSCVCWMMMMFVRYRARHVEIANEAEAIETLLISDELFRFVRQSRLYAYNKLLWLTNLSMSKKPYYIYGYLS